MAVAIRRRDFLACDRLRDAAADPDPAAETSWTSLHAAALRTFAWLSRFRRLRVRDEERADTHEAFLSLGCALICCQLLRKTWITA